MTILSTGEMLSQPNAYPAGTVLRRFSVSNPNKDYH